LTIEEKARFIELRAQGLSYDKIAKEIGISKPTLIKYSIEFKSEIDNEEFLKYYDLIEKYKLTKKAKIEFLCKEIEKLKQALGARNYKNLATSDLFNLMKNYENELRKETQGIEFRTGEVEPLEAQQMGKEKTMKLGE
jgi:transcriptional regulator with XRE-family HTH domain